MPRSIPVDGFSLEYDRHGAGPTAVLLHGWPGDRTDWDRVVALLDGLDLVVPDLRGFGGSDKHDEPPADAYSADAQARSVLGLLDELGVGEVLLAGYDVGSRVAQTIASRAPERVRAMVVSPPLPGAGRRVLEPEAGAEFWYQSFHQLSLAERLVDGDPGAVSAYLAYFWGHWGGDRAERDEASFAALVDRYSPRGAFRASIGWYRAGSGTPAMALAERTPAPGDRVRTPTVALWPTQDPLFPFAWSDRLEEFFADVELRRLPGVGHFTPVEAPQAFAEVLLGYAPTA